MNELLKLLKESGYVELFSDCILWERQSLLNSVEDDEPDLLSLLNTEGVREDLFITYQDGSFCSIKPQDLPYEISRLLGVSFISSDIRDTWVPGTLVWNDKYDTGEVYDIAEFTTGRGYNKGHWGNWTDNGFVNDNDSNQD